MFINPQADRSLEVLGNCVLPYLILVRYRVKYASDEPRNHDANLVRWAFIVVGFYYASVGYFTHPLLSNVAWFIAVSFLCWPNFANRWLEFAQRVGLAKLNEGDR